MGKWSPNGELWWGGVPMTRKLFDAKHIAELLSLRLSTVYKWVHEGRIPYYKLGKCVRFREDEVWSWVEKHKAKKVGSAADLYSARSSDWPFNFPQVLANNFPHPEDMSGRCSGQECCLLPG
jgi:excisionase family DNA binding protein